MENDFVAMPGYGVRQRGKMSVRRREEGWEGRQKEAERLGR